MRQPTLADQVVRWQTLHGRHHLPWQNTRDPYRVWLSEVMLQQTQVTTVLGYYQRFLLHFPTVADLAAAPQEQVLALWSGLGYYSRARNLHRCAQQVMQDYGGAFPQTAAQLATLPGIGRSTAGAIAAFCFAQRAPILDANVRRVLTRVLGFAQDLAVKQHENQLWALAEDLLPTDDLAHTMPRYTQGLMDLGASLCTPKNPQCDHCPLRTTCKAHAQGTPEHYPVRSRKVARPSVTWWLLLHQNPQSHWWLERRPNTGIWAGLYCPPVLTDGPLPPFCAHATSLPAISHTLTHRQLQLQPLYLATHTPPANTPGQWFSPAECAHIGLPAPVRKLLASLSAHPATPSPLHPTAT